MFKKLLIILMFAMTVTNTCFADKPNAEVARDSFNSMATNIIKEIETKYASGNIAVLQNRAGWRKYKYDELTYKIEFADTGLTYKPYIGTIHVSFWVFGLWDHNKISYRDTKEEAENVSSSELLGGAWYPLWEDPFSYLFTYEYNENNEWTLVATQAGYYLRYSDGHKIFTPQELCLIENYSKNPSRWAQYSWEMEN